MQAGLQVGDEAQAYRVQALVMAELGEIGGWKVGATGPAAAPNCAPLPKSGILETPAECDWRSFTQREVESEIFFRLGRDLPPRAAPYTAADILAAIASCHPGIEILQSRLPDPDHAGPLAVLADFIQHGAYVSGPAIADWQAIDFAALAIAQSIEGPADGEDILVVRRGNPAGDMIRLLVWLANEGAAWAGGLKASQVLTCGSWTGKTRAPAGSRVTAAFDGAAEVSLRFTRP
jgi:2-keto-4-pentenoate hydratase